VALIRVAARHACEEAYPVGWIARRSPMFTGDHCPEGGRPEAAGWVLSALEPEEALDFGEHLFGCPACRRAVADLEPAGRMLTRAQPAAEPPASLQARTLAKIRQESQKDQ
jgi:Putative zinc-finger